MATNAEQWLPVPGYEGHYSVSNLGRVRSEARTITGKNGIRRRWREYILKPYKNAKGYLQVHLWKNGKQQKRFVHRLVLEAFVGEAPPGTEACHWNDDPADNRLENLRWGTSGDNTLDMVRNGNHNNSRKTHCKRGHELTPENIWTYSDKKGRQYRQCRTCGNARRKAKTRGMTLEEYFNTAQQPQ